MANISMFDQIQVDWKEEIKEQLQKIKAEGSHMPQLEEDLIRRRREELRLVSDETISCY